MPDIKPPYCDEMSFGWGGYSGVLFDLDGVITPTAEVHMRAWSTMFNAFLSGHGIEPAYTDEDYLEYVDGKPRYDGVRSFVVARGIDLPEGDPSDAPAVESVCGLGNRKDELFGQLLRDEGVAPYAGSLALVELLRDRAMPMAIVSSSRNAPDVLAAAGIEEFFPVVIHGAVAAARGLPGKPAPDTYWAAADDLGIDRHRAVVIEDAVSGVAAGAAGGFGLVLGVDRGAGVDRLTRAGADLVVSDLGELL